VATRGRSHALAIATIALASGATALFWPLLGSSPVLLFFPAIILVALYGGLGPALFATVLSTASLAYFFLPPYNSFKVGPADFARLLVFVTTTVVITLLTGGRQRAEAALHRLTRDLEQRVEARTAELAAAQRSLDAAQHLEAIGQLAGGIAHDFNNLLTVILGNAEMVASRLPADTEVRTMFADLQRAAARAAALTRQLLAYSRRQPLQLELLSVNDVVRNVLPLLQRVVPDRVAVHDALAEGLPQVLADAGQLEQVIMNLAVNACDAMPAGGTLTLATTLVHLDAEELQDQSVLSPGPYIRLTATDTGTGMDAATARRAFEPYFTTKPMGQGTGLGLSTTHGIVAQLGGVVRLHTALGVGTTFSVYLPVCRDR
jgi:signal transduction histidine kinase